MLDMSTIPSYLQGVGPGTFPGPGFVSRKESDMVLTRLTIAVNDFVYVDKAFMEAPSWAPTSEQRGLVTYRKELDSLRMDWICDLKKLRIPYLLEIEREEGHDRAIEIYDGLDNNIFSCEGLYIIDYGRPFLTQGMLWGERCLVNLDISSWNETSEVTYKATPPQSYQYIRWDYIAKALKILTDRGLFAARLRAEYSR
jgi:hypothetical protein